MTRIVSIRPVAILLIVATLAVSACSGGQLSDNEGFAPSAPTPWSYQG